MFRKYTITGMNERIRKSPEIGRKLLVFGLFSLMGSSAEIL